MSEAYSSPLSTIYAYAVCRTRKDWMAYIFVLLIIVAVEIYLCRDIDYRGTLLLVGFTLYSSIMGMLGLSYEYKAALMNQDTMKYD